MICLFLQSSSVTEKLGQGPVNFGYNFPQLVDDKQTEAYIDQEGIPWINSIG